MSLLSILGALLLLSGPAAAQATGSGLRGDVNGDGSITALDGLAVLAYVVGNTLPAGYTLAPNGDADENGQITALDALIILGYTVGKDVSQYPVGRPIARGTSLVIVSGDNQTGTVGRPPAGFLVVRAVNAAGHGVRGMTVQWAVTSGGGSVDPATTVTDSTGTAQTVFTLGPQTGTNTATATIPGGASVTFSIHAGPAGAAVVSKTAGDGQAAVVGTAVGTAPTVRVTDANGNPVAAVPVTFAVATGGGSVTGATPTTDTAGVARVGSWTLGSLAGSNTLTATVSGLPAVTFTATGTTGAPAALSIQSGDGGTAVVGTTRTLQARIADAYGNGVSGQTVSWAVGSGGGSLSAASSTTDSLGIASIAWTFGTTAGAQTATATAAGLSGSPLTYTVTTTPAAAARLAVTVQPSNTTAGLSIAPAVQVTIQDAHGNTVHGATDNVTLALGNNPSGGTLAGTTTAAAVNGVATFSTLSIDKVGSGYTLTAGSGSLAGATTTGFDITPAAASQLVFTVQPTNATAGVAIAPAVQVTLRDAFGNTAVGATDNVTLAIGTNPSSGTLSGTATVAAVGGVATFSNLSINKAGSGYTLAATAGSLTGATSGGFDITAAAASQLVIAAQPSGTAQSGIALAQQPVVQLRDAFWNVVSQSGVSVTAAIATGGGTLGGTATVSTDGAGQAAFTNLSISGTVGARTLDFSATGLTGATSSTINLTAGAPATMAVDAGDGQTATAGTAVAAAPAVRITDASGNAVAGVSVTFAASGNGSVGGSPATTNASGVATLGGWTLATTAGANTLTATAGALSTTFNATGTAGSAASISKSAGDGQTATVGAAVSTAPQVTVTDQHGNPVAGVSVTFAASGNGSVGGSPATTNASGVATLGSWTLATAAGANTLTATAGALSITFNATGTPGAAAALAFTVQPSDAQAGAAIAPAVQVTIRDAFGNTVTGATDNVSLAITSGTGTAGAVLSGAGATTVNGVATFSGLSIDKVGSGYTLTASSGGLTSATSSGFAITPAAASQLVVTTQPPATAQSGIAFPQQPVLQLRDAFGNAVSQSGVPVTAAIASGGGTLGGTATVTTNASGQAVFTDLSIAGSTGSRTLGFSAAGLTGATSGTINLTAGAPSRLVVTTQPSDSARSGIAFPQQPVLQLQDAAGNPVGQSGVSVTAAIASGSGTLGGTATVTTSAGGQAVFTDLAISGTVGSYTLGFSATGLTGASSGTIVLAPGSASQLVITTQPSSTAQNGLAFATQPVLQLRDASGNDVAQAGVSVTAAIASGGGTLGGTATVATSAGGQATFTDLAVTGTVGSRTLGFSASGLPGATSNTISVTAGAPASLAIQAGDGQTSAAGSAVATAPSVVVRDASSNPVPGVAVTFAVASGGGSVTGATPSTDAGGIAAVGSWTLGTTVGANTLTASSAGLAAVTFSATGVAGPASAISIQSGDGGTATVATTRVLEARIVDAHGNPVSGHAVSWAAATGGGSMDVPSSSTNASGVATATWTFGTSAGAQTATATATGLTGSPLTYTVTTAAGAASTATSTLAASPSSITADSTSASTLTVQLRDQYGNALGASGGTVALSATGGTLSPVTDNGNGSYTATLTSPKTTGTATVSGTLNGSALTATATVTFTPGAATRYVVTSSADTVVAGSTVNITARLLDANGNVVPAAGRTVTWSSANGGTFASPTSATDSSGVATVVFTTSTTAGTTHTVTANDGSVSGTSGNVQTQVGAAASITKTGSDGVSFAAGSTVTPPPGVRITDANGNGVPGVGVTFAVTGGGGGLTGETQTTDATGLATLGSWTLGTTAGANTLSATAGSLAAGFGITGTAGPASAATTQITTADSVLTSGGTTSVTVQAKDQYGNNLATGGDTIALSTSLGSLGTVTDNGNGTYTAVLTHTGTNGTATITGTLRGAAITDNAQVSFQATGQRTWTGLAGSNWNTSGSWSPQVTPVATDTVIINGGGTQPQITDANKTVERLVMTSGAGTLNLGGFQLTITGDAVASSGTVSNGTVAMSGSGRTVQGTFPNLLFTGSVSASGSVKATSSVTVSGGALTISNQTLTISKP